MLRLGSFCLIALFLLGCNTIPTKKGHYEKQMLSLAEGNWGVVEGTDYVDVNKVNCVNSPLITSISNDGLIYYSITDGKKDVADILSTGSNYLKIKYRNETRIMSDGREQVWIMYFKTPDLFVWVREDWFESGEVIEATAPRQRCKKQTS